MKRDVDVTARVVVTYDPEAFSPEWMAEFREHFYPFVKVEEHLGHLAQLMTRGLTNGRPEDFVEGYGLLRDMGISMRLAPWDMEAEVSR